MALTASAPAAVEAGQPAAPNELLLRIPFPQDDGSLTPYTFELGYPLMTLVYDTLLWRDADGVPQPWLARTVEVSDDGRKVTVRLAADALWHDGVAVTAADVAFTLKFVAERAHPRFSSELSAVERVDTPDATTVVITLRRPSPGFSDQPLADVPILPAHLWRGLGRGQLAPEGLPVGSGPYRLVEYRNGESYRFDANPQYFRGAPTVASIEVPFIKSAQETVTALERRDVDMIAASLPEDFARQVEGLGTRIVKGPSYLGVVLMFNLRRPPFDDLAVRQAVAGALDLRQVARAVGDSVPSLNGYLHPASPWASKDPMQIFDDRAARQALAARAIPAIEVLAPENEPLKLEAARQVVSALRRIGLAAEFKGLARADISKAVGEDSSPPTFQAAIWGAPPLASYDPDFLTRLFGSDPAVATLNYAGYRSAEFDRLANTVASTMDLATRRVLVTEELRLLSTDLPVVPLFFPNGAYAYRQASYDGWVFVKGSGILDKRSFVSSEGGARPPPAVPSGISPTSESIPFGLVALGLAGMASLVAVVAVVRRRG